MEDIVVRFLENLAGRASGPMHLRLLLQPTMALIFAARAGLRDARSARPAYLWALFTAQEDRRELIRGAWADVGKVFVVALVLDLLYQLVTVRWIYPLESVTVAVVLAFVPYVLLRGVFARIGRVAGANADRAHTRSPEHAHTHRA